MKTLELVYFDAGGGHRSAADALCEIVRREERPWDMRLLNLQELLDELDVFRKITGIRLEDLYNLMLRKGWTLGSATLMKGMHGVIRLLHSQQVKLLTRYWRERQPDMVVSVIPNFNRALFESLALANSRIPMVTILTDIADYPPHFWIERQPQYFICGSEHAYRQAISLGNSPDRLFRTSGMILNPRFYEQVAVDRPAERQALGLDPDLPTALIMFGGEGSSAILRIAAILNASDLELQMIAICGRNQELEQTLRAMPKRIPMHIEGFTREVPRFMRVSDFFIGKPGPGSISEAIALGLPVIIERNIKTLPQERYNARWVEEEGVGISVRSFDRQIVDAVSAMLDPARRCEFVRAVRNRNNRAVFEIPELLDGILRRHSGGT